MKNAHWKLVAYKVRNMRTVYRRAKEYEINKKDSKGFDPIEIRSKLKAPFVSIPIIYCMHLFPADVMLRICWYLDEFDVLFPTDIDNYLTPISKGPSSDDDGYPNQESHSINDGNNSCLNFNDQCLQELPTANCLPQSIERDILAVQTGRLSCKKLKYDEDLIARQANYELARDQFVFEKEKFRQEIRVKEKAIDSRERLKIMELQMKERVAMREVELKQKLALQSIEKQEPYNNVYHSLS